MIAFSLLFVVSAHAVVSRAPVARAVPVVAPRIALGSGASLRTTLTSPADAPSPLPAPSLGLAPDREAALVAKLAAKLPSQDATSRAKTAAWIRDVALENPRAAVQSAAVDALAQDAEAAGNLVHFENLASDIEAVASATPFDHVFEDAVGRLVDVARRSGRAQRAQEVGLVAARLAAVGVPSAARMPPRSSRACARTPASASSKTSWRAPPPACAPAVDGPTPTD